MDAGTLFRYNKHVPEACISKDNACSGCTGFTGQASCAGSRYFRRLPPFEVCKAIRDNREIKEHYQP